MIQRSTIFSLLLFLVHISGGGWLPVMVFTLYAAYFFITPVVSPFLPALFTVMMFALSRALTLGDDMLVGGAVAMFAFVATYIFQYARRHPSQFYRPYVLLFGFFVMALFGIRVYQEPALFAVSSWMVPAFLAAWAYYEFFTVLARLEEGALSRRTMAMRALVFSFLLVQLMWGLSLLPIGPLNTAALLGLVFFFSLDLYVHALAGALTQRIALRHVSVFVFVAALIFALSQWTV